MAVAHELGKDLYDVSHWSYDDLMEWHAFLRLKAKAEKKALDRVSPNYQSSSAPVFSSGAKTVIID